MISVYHIDSHKRTTSLDKEVLPRRAAALAELPFGPKSLYFLPRQLKKSAKGGLVRRDYSLSSSSVGLSFLISCYS